MSSTVKQHTREFSHTVHEDIPAHPPRGKWDDSFYQKEREAAIKEADGCFICGRTEEDLKKNDDGYGRWLETHHWACEWSLWDAVDKDLIQSLFDSCVMDWYGFCKDKKGEPVNHPGDRRNLLVLCPRHHRYSPDPGKGGGVHNMPFPIWLFQVVKENSFELFSKPS